MSMSSRVLVIGLDSMDKDLVLEWANGGVLPNIKRLLERSAWGSIENPTGLVSGSAWSSFYTGVTPDRHGQYNAYEYFDTESYHDVSYTKSRLPYDPVWEALSRENRRVVIIDAPYSFLSENINGVQIMDWGTHVRLHDSMPPTWPADLAAEIDTRFGRDPLGTGRGSPCDQGAPRSISEYTAFRDKLLDRLNRKAELSEFFMARESWDFFLTVFCEPHCVGHQCWHIHDPAHASHDPELARAIGDPVKDVYAGIDAAVGRLLARVERDATVMIYCGLGMGPQYTGTNLLDQILWRLEGNEPSTLKERGTDALRQVWRRAPQRLRTALMPVRRNLWEPIYQTAIVPERSTRKFFEIAANNATGGVRINLIGRESHGLVQPGAEFELLCDQLTEDLLAMTNVDSGEPVVKEVLRTDRIYPGEQRHRLPDLLVQWNRSAPILRVTSPKTGLVENRHLNVRTGDHKHVGLFCAAGPSVAPRKLNANVSVVDFAPTIAALLGVALPSVNGRPIDAVMGEA